MTPANLWHPSAPLIAVSLDRCGDSVLDGLQHLGLDSLRSSSPPEALISVFRQALGLRPEDAGRGTPPRPEFVFLGQADELNLDEAAAKLELAQRCLRRSALPGSTGMLLGTDVLKSQTPCEAIVDRLLALPGLSHLVLLDTLDSAGRCWHGENALACLMRLAFECLYASQLAGPLGAVLHNASAHSSPEERCFAVGLRKLPVSAAALRRNASRRLLAQMTGHLLRYPPAATRQPPAGQPVREYLETLWQTGETATNLALLEAAANELVFKFEGRLQAHRARDCSRRVRAVVASLCAPSAPVGLWARLIRALGRLLGRGPSERGSSEEPADPSGWESAQLGSDQTYLGRVVHALAQMRAAVETSDGLGQGLAAAPSACRLGELIPEDPSERSRLPKVLLGLLPWQDVAGGQSTKTLMARMEHYCEACVREVDWVSQVPARTLHQTLVTFQEGVGVSWPRPGLARRHSFALVPDTLSFHPEGVEVVSGTTEEIVCVELAQGISLQIEDEYERN